jgi:hypothetical protein
MADTKSNIPPGKVQEFLNSLPDNQVKTDCYILKKIVSEITGCQPKMWGKNIVGFGSYHYKYESGREGDTCLIGLSPKKDKITLYLAPYFDEDSSWAEKLGKVAVGKGCLYISKIEDVDIKVLKSLILHSIQLVKERHGSISLV